MNPHAWYALAWRHVMGKTERFEQAVMHLPRFDPRMTRRPIVESGRSDLAHLVKDLVV
jgi:hypothetical protein